MKITYQTTATLNQDQIFALMKEIVDSKTNKDLCNIYWVLGDNGISCKLLFSNKDEELKQCISLYVNK